MTFSRRTRWLLLTLILCVGFFVRFYQLGATTLVADEFLDINATYGHHKTGEWQAWDWNMGGDSLRDNRASDERAWIYRIQVSWLYNFLPPEAWAMRLISVVWGTLTILIIYGVTYSLTRNHFIALLAGALWALSVPAIEINRKIRMYSMFAPIFLLFTWSLYIFIERGRRHIQDAQHAGFFDLRWSFLVPTIILGLLSVHLHLLALNIGLALFVYCLLRSWQTSVWRTRAFGRFTQYSILMVISLIVIWSLQLPQVESLSRIIGWEWNAGYITHLLRSFWHPFLGAALILIGLWQCFSAPWRPAYMWIGTIFAVITALALFTWNRNTGEQYIFFMQPFALILAAIGVHAVGLHIIRYAKQPHRTYILFVLPLFFLPFYGYFFLENNTYHLTTSSGTVNYEKVLQRYFSEHADPEKEVLITRNFRNYYYSGLGIKVYDFGSERSAAAIAPEGKVRKITAPYLQEIMDNHPQGWMIYASNDKEFITKEARELIDQKAVLITDSSLVRGDVSVYRWNIQK